MTDSHAMLVMTLTQAALALGIWGDKWVHRVTGKKSLEARVGDLEEKLLPLCATSRVETLERSVQSSREAMAGTLDDLHEKASDYAKAQQVVVGRVERHLGDLKVQIAAIDQHLKNTDANIDRLERRRGNR